MEFPYDKFLLYVKIAHKVGLDSRRANYSDLSGAIAGVFTKDGVKKYMKMLEDARDEL